MSEEVPLGGIVTVAVRAGGTAPVWFAQGPAGSPLPGPGGRMPGAAPGLPGPQAGGQMAGEEHKPSTDRPWMYGSQGLKPVLLPWSWAEHRLINARNYWIATTRPDGRPHTRPVWGVWLENAFHFSTGSLAAGNIAQNPAITLHLENGAEVVVIESEAAVVDDQSLVRRLVMAYNEKYLWDLDPARPDVWYRVPARLAFGWIVDDTGQDRGASFHATATRWRFA